MPMPPAPRRNGGRYHPIVVAARRRVRQASDPPLQRLLREMIAARRRAGLTQREVAVRMGTTPSAISRLEVGIRSRPTLSTLENYALVVGCRIEIRLRPWP